MILFHLVHCSVFLLLLMSHYPLIVARSLQAGEESYARYKHLISEKDVPFVRAASSKRVVKSARKWTQGTQLESALDYAFYSLDLQGSRLRAATFTTPSYL